MFVRREVGQGDELGSVEGCGEYPDEDVALEEFEWLADEVILV